MESETIQASIPGWPTILDEEALDHPNPQWNHHQVPTPEVVDLKIADRADRANVLLDSPVELIAASRLARCSTHPGS